MVKKICSELLYAFLELDRDANNHQNSESHWMAAAQIAAAWTAMAV